MASALDKELWEDVIHGHTDVGEGEQRFKAALIVSLIEIREEIDRQNVLLESSIECQRSAKLVSEKFLVTIQQQARLIDHVQELAARLEAHEQVVQGCLNHQSELAQRVQGIFDQLGQG